MVDDLRPHRIDKGQHLLRHGVDEADHALAQGIDVVTEVIGREDGGVDADVAGEARHRDVLDAARAQDLAQAGAAEAADLAARRQAEIAVAGVLPQGFIVGRFLRADLPGAAPDLAAVEAAGIGGIELAIVRAVALGDVHNQHALGARLVHQLDRTLEHAGLGEMVLELAVPSAVGRHEIRLEVDQQDRGLLRFQGLRHRRHRLGARGQRERHCGRNR